MRRRLHEAKADIEVAIVKSLGGARLTLTELQELQDLTERDLMIDHDLDYILATRVRTHMKSENYRMRAQNLQTPIDGYESDATSLTRSFPINESKRLGKRQITRLIRNMINEELRR